MVNSRKAGKRPNSIDGKVVLITGGTGSFGKNFTKYILKEFSPKKVIIFSRDELKQFRLEREIQDDRVRFFLGDVRDRDRLMRAFTGVNVVIHAAALKQVPALEYNPSEAIKTNVIGTQNVIEAAIDANVDKVVLVSTDKAAYPINLYRSTKLCAEKLTISGNAYSSKGKTKLSCVRYGNVVGSRGSLVDLLLRDPNMKEVLVTHADMTRFWLMLAESFKLVMFALENMCGGEIFIPKVPSMKVLDVINALVPSAKKKIVGIRPGEKMHEVLMIAEETHRAIDLGNYFAVLPDRFDPFTDREVRYASLFKRGKQMNPGAAYTSDSNHDWFSQEKFIKMTRHAMIEG